MPLQVNDVDTLKTYIEGVMHRAGHHAGNVDGVALALAGAIVWKKDADPIEVMEVAGSTKNVMWVRFASQRYAFSYNHDAKAIEVRRNSTQGPVVSSFSNTSTQGLSISPRVQRASVPVVSDAGVEGESTVGGQLVIDRR